LVKKILFFLILLIISSIVIYFSCKGYLLYTYKVDTLNNLKEKIKSSGKKITIIKNTNKAAENMTFENIIYPKLKDRCDLKEDSNNLVGYNYSTCCLYDSNNKNTCKAIFKVGTYAYTMYKVVTMNNPENPTFGFAFKGTNDEKLLNNYGIKNNVDLFEYIFDHYNNDINIFTKRDDMRILYLVKIFANTIIPVSNIFIIDGDYSGYMYIVNNNYYEVNLIYNEKTYIFAFKNDKNREYFNLENIKEFISNVTFD